MGYIKEEPAGCFKDIILVTEGEGDGVRMDWGGRIQRFVGRMVKELTGRHRGRLLTQLQQDGGRNREGMENLCLGVTAHVTGQLTPVLLRGRLHLEGNPPDCKS